MNETDTPTNISNNPDQEHEEHTNSAARRLIGGGFAVGLVAGAGAGVALGQEAQRNVSANIAEANQAEDDALLNQIENTAESYADPLDIQENFTLQDGQFLIDAAKSVAVDLPLYQEDPKGNEYTLQQSATEIGVYHPGETFAITAEDYNGEKHLFVQRIRDAYDEFADANNIEFYNPTDEQRQAFNEESTENDESTFVIPTPKTH